MSISAYLETTKWSDVDFEMPQHIYLFDGKSNALAYAKKGGEEIQVFKNPLKIDTRRRTFVKVKHKNLDLFAKTVKRLEEPKANNVTSFAVKSDSGKEYIVENVSGKWVCNCIGFSYRNKCKHSEKVKNENSSNK
jgi:hypothetical protein